MTKQEREINLRLNVIAYDHHNALILMGQDPKEKRDYKVNLDDDSILLLKKHFKNSK